MDPQYLDGHCESLRSLDRHSNAWMWLALCLQLKRSNTPKAITACKALDYIDCSTSYKKKPGKTVDRNTAILELRILSICMGEAVWLGHTDDNLQIGLKLQRKKTAKPERCSRTVVQNSATNQAIWFLTPNSITKRRVDPTAIQ